MHTTNLPWAEMPFFLSLARARNFSAAAVELGKDRTTIARRLARIEAHLDRQLFERTDEGLVITTYGRRVLEIAELAEQEMQALPGAAAQQSAQQSVRIAISEHLLSAVAPHMAKFALTHSEYLLDFVTSDTHADLEHFEADIAVRLSGREPHGLYVIPAGRPSFSLYALRGIDPAEVRYIARPSEDDPPNKIKTYYPNMRIAVRANGIHSTLSLVKAGFGCAILPDYIGQMDAQLEAMNVPGFFQRGQINVICRNEQRRLQKIKSTTRALSDALNRAAGIE